MFKKLFNRPFFKKTALGRTLSGRNKTGQTLGIVKDVAVSFVPIIGKPLSEIKGKVTSEREAFQVGKAVQDLNLSDTTIKWVRIGAGLAFGYLFVQAAVNGTLAKLLVSLQPIIEFLQSIGVL